MFIYVNTVRLSSHSTLEREAELPWKRGGNTTPDRNTPSVAAVFTVFRNGLVPSKKSVTDEEVKKKKKKNSPQQMGSSKISKFLKGAADRDVGWPAAHQQSPSEPPVRQLLQSAINHGTSY